MNNTVVLGATNHSASQFQCSVRASLVPTFEWTFTGASGSVQQIVNEVGPLDVKYLVGSSDYSSVLTVQNLQFSDAGEYSCIASIGGSNSTIKSANFLNILGEKCINFHVTDNDACWLLCSAS